MTRLTGLNSCFEMWPEEARVVPASPLPGAHELVSAWEGGSQPFPTPIVTAAPWGGIFSISFFMLLLKSRAAANRKRSIEENRQRPCRTAETPSTDSVVDQFPHYKLLLYGEAATMRAFLLIYLAPR